METHVIPKDYEEPSYYRNDDSWVVCVVFPTFELAEAWTKQRRQADEIAVELEEYESSN